MNDNIIIEIPMNFNYAVEIKNEIKKFIDRYRVDEFNDERLKDYRDVFETYIAIDRCNIEDLLANTQLYFLSFRVPGATRGKIELQRICDDQNNNYTNTEYLYRIVDIHFIDETCFTRSFHVYDRSVINAVKSEFTNTTVHFKFINNTN